MTQTSTTSLFNQCIKTDKIQRIEATASISGRNVNDEKAASYNKNKINKIRMINIQDGAIKHIQKAVSAASHLPGSLHDEKKNVAIHLFIAVQSYI